MKSKTPILIVFLAALLSGCQQVDKQSSGKLEERISKAIQRRPPRTEPVLVGVVPARQAEGSQQTSYVGRVQTARNAVVSTPHSGILVRMAVRRGQRVKEGDVLAEVSSEYLQSAYDMAAATLEQAQDGFDRLQKVYESGSVTEQKYIEVRTQLDRARTAERAARSALDECVIRAPFAATVSDIAAEQGTRVDALAPLVRLVDTGRLEVTFAVPEHELSAIHVGDDAEVVVPALAESFHATVSIKGITASALSHSYDCTLSGLPSTQGLMPGMVCKVRLVAAGQSGVLIPASAVLTDTDGRYVWLADSLGTVSKRHVTVGGFSGRDIVISHGLHEGEQVITKGSQKISSGMKVRIETNQ